MTGEEQDKAAEEPSAQAAMVGAVDVNEQLDQQPAAAGPAGQAKAASSSEMQQEPDESVEPALTEQQSQVLGSYSAAFQPLVDQLQQQQKPKKHVLSSSQV